MKTDNRKVGKDVGLRCEMCGSPHSSCVCVCGFTDLEVNILVNYSFVSVKKARGPVMANRSHRGKTF